MNDQDAPEPICHRYDIEKDLWQEMKELNQARGGHSSCHLGGHIYVFCGIVYGSSTINTVEKLFIDTDPTNQVS